MCNDISIVIKVDNDMDFFSLIIGIWIFDEKLYKVMKRNNLNLGNSFYGYFYNKVGMNLFVI